MPGTGSTFLSSTFLKKSFFRCSKKVSFEIGSKEFHTSNSSSASIGTKLDLPDDDDDAPPYPLEDDAEPPPAPPPLVDVLVDDAEELPAAADAAAAHPPEVQETDVEEEAGDKARDGG